MYSADLSLDASSNGWTDGGPGLGGYCFATHEFFATGVPSSMASWNISDLELLACLVALRLWGKGWSRCSVNLLTDNESVRHLIGNGRTRSPLRLKMARSIVGLQFSGEFRIVPARISTGQNVLADALSRLGEDGMWHRFSSVCSRNDVSPRRILMPASTFDQETW